MVATRKTISFLCVSFIATLGYCQDANPQLNRVLQSPKSTKTPLENSGSSRTFSISHSEEHQESLPENVTIETFTPIEATGFTDPNYHNNLIKSQSQRQLLDATPLPASSPILTKQERLLIYTTERDKYAVGSFEYNAIQAKIDNLDH